jgi:hypothetical protein
MRISRSITAIVLGVGLALAASGQEANRQEVIPVDDPAYRYLDLLLLETGLPQPSSFRPYTAEEFNEYIDLIPLDRLSGPGRELLELLIDRLHPRMLVNSAGGLGFSSSLQTSLEYYTKADAESDYIFSRGDRLPMLSFPLELWFFDSVYANATFTLAEDYRLTSGRWEPITYTAGETSPAPAQANHWNWFSPETNLLELDWYFPFRALISVGGPHWHLTYGRDSMDVGNGSTGNLLLSDFPDSYDSIILSTNWRFFKGTTAYVYFEPWLTPSDQARLASGEYFMRLRDYGLPYKALMLHQLEIRPLVNYPRLPQVGFFASEAIMFGSQYPQIRDFNPFMIFHNWFEYERSNDSFLVGFNLVPIPGVELYGEYFLNEFDTSYEGGGNFPGAAGWLGGVRGMYAAPFGVFSGYAEYVLTDPLLYNRYHPLLKFVSRRRIWSYIEPDQMIYVDKPIGYYTGPDTQLVSVGVSYELPPRVEAHVAYSYINKGEKGTESPYAETPGEETPTGTPWRTHVLDLSADYTPLPMVTVGGSVYLVFDSNLEHQPGLSRSDIQAAVHVTLRAGANP